MKIHVLASGGVDSSVALHLLAAEGRHELVACYLKIWLEEELSGPGECPWEEDLECVRAVCGDLGVPVEVVPLQREYRERVVRYTVGELRAGRTPSPDIFCNQRIKYGAFLDRVPGGAVASGHYARVEERAGRRVLLKGVDPVKDQTYFLSHLSREQLARCLFPIGHLHKREVRALAAELALPNRNRPDSQGICFLGEIPFDEFVRLHLGENPGPIVDIDSGRELGRHRGIWFHTVGQRRGLGLGGGPWFVVGKDIPGNRILVAHAERLPEHSCTRFAVEAIHWIDGGPDPGAPLTAKLRHSPDVVACELHPTTDPDRAVVTLAEPDPGVAPGQFAIFYQGERCLGGGCIAAQVSPGVGS